MADRTCTKCGAVFAYPRDLKRHQNRKTPCDPILELNVRDGHYGCKYCGRELTSLSSLKKHIRSNCKIANNEKGMALLVERTLQKQVEKLENKVTELSALVGKNSLSSQFIHQTTNIGVQQVNVNVISFGGDDRIRIPASLVKAAFTENPMLREYCDMEDSDKVDADKAAPYVLEVLVDLIRRAHQDPVYRNVYLSPGQKDQVMVCICEENQSGRQNWEMRSLSDVTRLLFDGVAGNIQKIVITEDIRAQLPMEIQGAASWVPSLYCEEPERYVKDGQEPMALHFANTRQVSYPHQARQSAT